MEKSWKTFKSTVVLPLLSLGVISCQCTHAEMIDQPKNEMRIEIRNARSSGGKYESMQFKNLEEFCEWYESSHDY